MRDVKVCVSFDFDAVCSWMSWGSRDGWSLSRGEFGATTAAPRLLELCRRQAIPSTWFVPGHTADTYPEITARVAADGHEIANHGYLHENFGALTVEQARAVLRKGNETLQRVTGQTPRGFRLPLGGYPEGFFQMMVEEGFLYDSSTFGEFEPHWCRTDRVLRDDGPNTPGRELPLVEIPVTFITSDFAYFEFSFMNPELRAGLRNPRDVEQVWQDQFSYLYEHVGDGYVMLMLHPQSIGWASRILMLERFIEFCAGHSGTRFVTAETIAEEFRAKAQPPAGDGSLQPAAAGSS